MILVYTPDISSRIVYTCNLVFNELLGIDYKITGDRNIFSNASDIRINYSQQNFNGIININPSGLLMESGISHWEPKTTNWEELPVIFANEEQPIPFDIFAAIFFLVTRYEEYLPFNADSYGRFKAEESIAYKNKFLRLPIVDLWCKKLAQKLAVDNLCKNLSEANYRFHLTIDIDHPWLYKNKGRFYAAGSLIRELLRFNFPEFTERFGVLTGMKTDPADTYELLSEVQKNLQYPVQYFILCRKKGQFDKNRSVHRKVFHSLIKRLDKSGSVGIHPSFVSNTLVKSLGEEISYLSGVLGRDITFSRQHFLILKFPETYRRLIESGITADYSMGYSSQTGFRAGIARSYNYFDLMDNQETSLRIFPFQIMDRTLLSYMNLSPDAAVKEFEHYSGIIRSVGGEFICLWHNDSLSDQGEWIGWNRVFKKMIEMNQ